MVPFQSILIHAGVLRLRLLHAVAEHGGCQPRGDLPFFLLLVGSVRRSRRTNPSVGAARCGIVEQNDICDCVCCVPVDDDHNIRRRMHAHATVLSSPSNNSLNKKHCNFPLFYPEAKDN